MRNHPEPTIQKKRKEKVNVVHTVLSFPFPCVENFPFRTKVLTLSAGCSQVGLAQQFPGKWLVDQGTKTQCACLNSGQLWVQPMQFIWYLRPYILLLHWLHIWQYMSTVLIQTTNIFIKELKTICCKFIHVFIISGAVHFFW